MKTIRLLLACAALCGLATAPAFAQGTAFTYQGVLSQGGAAVNGSNDLTFTLYTAVSGGSTVGTSNVVNDLRMTNGLFTVTLDFGVGAFDGSDRWLQIAVRPGASAGAYTNLAPRQSITAAPYAITASNLSGTLPATQLAGTVPDARLSSNVALRNGGNTFNGQQTINGSQTVSVNQTVNGSQTVAGAVAAASFFGDGSGLTGLNAANLTGTISANNIAAGSITASKLAAGSVTSNQLAAGAVATMHLADGAVSLQKLHTLPAAILSTTFTNPTPVGGDQFGHAVAAVGADKVLIGAYGDDTVANNAGAAYLFSTTGTLLTTFTNPTPVSADVFGYAVAAVGTDKVLIGAYRDDTGAPDAGAAYLFSTNGTLLTTFANPTPANFGLFGSAVAAVDADKVLIGAYGDNQGVGAAYLFSTNGTLLATFTNPTPVTDDQFGHAVAAVGADKVLIGAYLDDTGAENTGAAYLFSTNGTLLATFANPTPAGDDYFGHAVAAVGADKVLIGADGDNQGTGAAYLFSTNGALLTTYPTPAGFDNFGVSVAAVGTDKVLIGAYSDDTGASDAGAAHLFSTNGTLLATFTNPTPADSDFFGYPVAAVGTDKVLIGAYSDDTGASDAGAAYLFSLDMLYVPGLVSQGVADGAITTSSLANGAVTSDKLAAGSLFNGTFVGDGSGLTGLNAGNVTSGTVPDARLSANVALRGGGNVFTGNQTVTSGQVGIGTTTLSDKPLSLRGNGGNGEWLALRDSSDILKWHLNNSQGGLDFVQSGVADGRLFLGTNGNVGIGTINPTNKLHVAGGVSATVFVTTSDRNAKENFSPVDVQAMLAKVAALPITQWNFKEDKGTLHLGPMAQDFHAAFQVGPGATGIATVDADGVALAAIQGLNQKVEEREAALRAELKRRDALNAQLQEQNQSLEQRVAALEKLINRLSTAKGGAQ